MISIDEILAPQPLNQFRAAPIGTLGKMRLLDKKPKE